MAFTIARALELKRFKTRDGQFALRFAELSSDLRTTLDELSDKTGNPVLAQKTIAMQKKSILRIIKDRYGQHTGASAEFQGKCETQLARRHCWLRVQIYEIVDS